MARKYLAIETSSPKLSLAIGDDKKVIARFTGKHDWRHAESVFNGIKKLLKRARWKVQDLDGVAVSTGPGSFTGIRIGLAVARTLAQSLKITVTGVSSLEILAAANSSATWLAPQIDALRDHVFAALYERNAQGKLRRVIAESMVPAKDWPAMVMRRSRRNRVWLPKLSTPLYPQASVLLQLARPALAKPHVSSYESVLPLYIRKAAAQERLR